jgi:hypothetical protein
VKLFFVYFLLMNGLALNAQQEPASTDSIEQRRELKKRIYASPRKASMMSAILPGLGQAYNRKYWKIPVLYAGIGGFAYLFKVNNDEYNFYRKNLIAEYDDDPATLNTSYLSGDQLQSQKTHYRRLRDLAVLGIGALYILNIIDANVDAHLKTFDVSDDLSVAVSPWFPAAAYGGAGVRFTIRFD